jgi:hypothetical protein
VTNTEATSDVRRRVRLVLSEPLLIEGLYVPPVRMATILKPRRWCPELPAEWTDENSRLVFVQHSVEKWQREHGRIAPPEIIRDRTANSWPLGNIAPKLEFVGGYGWNRILGAYRVIDWEWADS